MDALTDVTLLIYWVSVVVLKSNFYRKIINWGAVGCVLVAGRRSGVGCLRVRQRSEHWGVGCLGFGHDGGV
eukprot:scaffold70268_cov71-Attheya_sp.AAC.1